MSNEAVASRAEGAQRASPFGAWELQGGPARLVKPERTMGRIRIQPAGQAFKQRVEEWMQSLTDHDFEILAARRDQLIGQLEALYRSVRLEVGMQT